MEMMKILRAAAVLAIAINVWAANPAIEGRYTGDYLIGGMWHHKASLVIKGKGGVSGTLTFEHFKDDESLETVSSTFEFAGNFDKRGNYLVLKPKKWIGNVPKGRVGGREGPYSRLPDAHFVRIHPEGLAFDGMLTVGFARDGSAMAARISEMLQTYAKGYLRLRTPPERRKTGTNLTREPWEKDFEYIEAPMIGQPAGNAEIEPIDKVLNQIKKADTKCLVTHDVVWRESAGVTHAQQFGTKFYVIECRGDCRGLFYRPERILGQGIAGEGVHFGLATQVPVLKFSTALFATYDHSWRFTWRGSGPPPRVRIHVWTDDPDDQGPGCQLY